MTKKEANDTIDIIFNYIENSTDENNLKGHPGIFFFHSREDFNKLKESLLDKDEYDKYDIYYIGNKLIKYLVGRYDSHTKINFIDYEDISIRFKTINDEIILVESDNKEYNGIKLASVNGIPISTIIKELEPIICYSTSDFLNIKICKSLTDINVLRSLPSINKDISDIVYGFSNDEVHAKDIISNKVPSIGYEVKDNVCIITYRECSNKDYIQEMINDISKLDIDNYIVDIRGNTGGRSSIIKPLIMFLDGKKVVSLIDKEVYSSGIWAALDLKLIGAYTIGEDIASPINHFGNASSGLELEDLSLFIKTSRKYFLYNEGKYSTYYKDNFEEYFKDKKELLEPNFFIVDKKIVPSKEDIVNKNDVVMDYAINYIKGKNKTK